MSENDPLAKYRVTPAQLEAQAAARKRTRRALSMVLSTTQPRALMLELHKRFFAGKPFAAFADHSAKMCGADELDALVHGVQRSLSLRSTENLDDGFPAWSLGLHIAPQPSAKQLAKARAVIRADEVEEPLLCTLGGAVDTFYRRQFFPLMPAKPGKKPAEGERLHPNGIVREVGPFIGDLSAMLERCDDINRKEINFALHWLETNAVKSVTINLEGGNDNYFPRGPSTVSLRDTGTSAEVEPVLALLSELDFEVASFGHIYGAMDPAWDLPHPGFADLHQPHGWACAFKGKGFERLVSRRWLEDGPWKLHRGANDTCLVQFHDLDLEDSARAREVARPGHDLIGISERGGYIQSGYTANVLGKVDGLFVPKTGELKIAVHGRGVAPVEMLDARVLWKCQRLEGKTIRQVIFVFDDEAIAREHLPLLQRYELGCAAIVAGTEVRLDA
jgi:hypothetical protein